MNPEEKEKRDKANLPDHGRPEGKGRPEGAGGGQLKTHEATRTNPDTGLVETRTFTQDEWRNRVKSDGWTRPEDADAPEPDEPVA